MDYSQGQRFDPGLNRMGQPSVNNQYRGYNPYLHAVPDYTEEYDTDDPDELDPTDVIYDGLDLSPVLGQQLAIWSHKKPDTLGLYTPVMGDTFLHVVIYARNTLDFNSAVDKMMILLPGYRRPLDMDSVFLLKPGTSVLIAPLYDYMVTLEVKQLGHRVDMVVNLTMSVQELKARLQTERGYPMGRIDLLYKDKPMENARYLFDYSVTHGATIFVLVTLTHDVLVHVETFWGKSYHLQVDACSTGLNVMASVLRRTVSQNVLDAVRLYELFLPKHTLVLYLGGVALDWDTCLGFYGVASGHVIRMSTIGLAHEMAVQKVPVLLDSGKSHHVLASKFDRWSAVVLKLHGLTGYPVNLMRLTRPGNHAIDFSDTVGSYSPISPPVRLDVSAVATDYDLLYGVPLRFKVTKGVTEVLKVSPTRTVKSVKDTLERVGVPHAGMADLMVDTIKLPPTGRIADVVEEYKRPIDLVLKQYPVFIHGPHNIIYKMLVYSKETLAAFLMRVKMKTGLSFKDYNLLRCGQTFNENENKKVFDTSLSTKSSIFIIPRKDHRIFFILNQEWMTKLRLPILPQAQQIKDTLWKERNVPEGGLASIGNFLQWYFFPHKGDKLAASEKKRPQLKDKMAMYEANVGNNFMQMKVDKKGRGRGHKRAHSMPMDQGADGGARRSQRHRSADQRFTLPTSVLQGYHQNKIKKRAKAKADLIAQQQRRENQLAYGNDPYVFTLRHEHIENVR